MKAKKIIKWACGIAAALLVSALTVIGGFIYVTRYRITDIDAASSGDGQYEVIFQAVGEPDWPFGNSHARIVLKHNGAVITKRKFDVANDGAILHPDNWSVRWEENCVKAVISGEEQPDELYTFFFNGTVRYEAPDARKPEDHGADSAESLSDGPMPDFSELAAENANGESVFAIPVEELISCYNSVYRRTHETDYLNPTDSENWYCYDGLSPCFGYASVRYKFSADKSVWPMPTISIYAPDKDAVYEIRMTFDHHGYQDGLYALYEELCICMEKTLLPELSEADAEALFEMLYARADDNFFGNHAAFDDPERPALNAVYPFGNIGVYSFYGSGNIEICFVPLTAGALEFLQENGIPLPDWREPA